MRDRNIYITSIDVSVFVWLYVIAETYTWARKLLRLGSSDTELGWVVFL